MNLTKISIAVLFLTATAGSVYGQIKNDTIKKEKNLEGVTIKGSVKKSDESNLINLQKKSVEIVETVGASQLSKQGVGDVATAVTKATGTIKQEGSKTISVRGLLDRYNTSTLNGLPIPSDDPENKNIDLALLKTEMIEFIAIEKVFSPRLSGDFGGANIDIISKEYKGKPYIGINLSSSVNSQIFDADKFYLQRGPNFWGYKTVKAPSKSLLQYPAKTSWNFKDTFQNSNFTPVNSGLDLEAGKTFNIGNTKLSAYAYAGFGNGYTYANGIEGNYNSEGHKLNYFNVDKYNYATNTTGLVNLFYRLNSNHQLKFISNYIHSTNQEVRLLQGYNYDWATENNGYIRRASFKATNLWVNQLGGDHAITSRLDVNWILGYNFLNSQQPDRMTNSLQYDAGNRYYKIRRDGGSSNSYYDNLFDNEISGNVGATYKITDAFKASFGYQGRMKSRDFRSRQYDFRYTETYAAKSFTYDPNNLDYAFNQSAFDTGMFRISSNLLNQSDNTMLSPMSFKGDQMTNAGYVNFDYKINERFIAMGGLRYDNINQDLKWHTNYTFPTGQTIAKYNYSKFLPSLNMKYEISDKQNLKLSASRTYTLPQMKEMAPYIYENITEASVGNIYLKPSDNNNFDAKWEFFPKRGELISLTGYGKYIQNPISKALVGEGLFSYLNVGDHAYVWGLEAEVRKDLIRRDNNKLYAFVNASYLNSKTQLSTSKIKKETFGQYSSSFDATEDRLQEAADFIANANLGYNYNWNKNNLDFTIAYSYVGENLYAVSTQNLGNVVQKPISTLDAILKIDFSNNILFGLNAKNLINPEIKRVQQTKGGDAISYQYKKGREFGISLGYKF